MSGRKSKYKNYDESKKVWNVGKYLRLSVENNINNYESDSISNQRKLIDSYLENEEDINNVYEYVDDGYTGTTFDRPGFRRMFEDIKKGKINAIIVKDLSRLGRNYIEIGNYIEQIFPLYHLRIVSINDKVDSYKDSSSLNNLTVSFKNLMNDEYCRDISKKIKSALRIKKLNGEFCGGVVVYGYKRDENDKNKIIIDEEAADVVKTIFQMSLNGNGVVKISKYLNENGIPSPCEYMKSKGILKENGKKSYWETTHLRRMLKNEIYCGNTINCKWKSKSYKDHRVTKNEKKNWIYLENTHEPIIDRETFNKVQEGIKSRYIKRTDKQKNNLFRGFLFCADCKRRMEKKDGVNKNGGFYYYCSTYSKISKDICSMHKIYSIDLEKMVKRAINLHISLTINIEKAIKEIKNNKNNIYENNYYYNRLKELENKIEINKRLKKKTYEDWKSKKITEQDFIDFKNEYDNEITSYLDEQKELNIKKENYSNIVDNGDWIKELKKNQKIDKVTPDILNNLIEKIYVSENGKINIVFKYSDYYKKTLDFIKCIRKEWNDER